jgi:alanine racemase
MRPTINDIASRAGVSKTTVSFALNDPSRISAETYERIMAIVAELGYVPDPVARTLTTKRLGALGVLLPQPIFEALRNPYICEVIRGIGEVCEEHELSLTMLPPIKGRVIEAARRAFVDGLLTIGVGPGHEVVGILHRRHIPFVTIDGAAVEETINVGIDDAEAARGIMSHVLGLGHRRLAILALRPETLNLPEKRYSLVSDRRLSGFRTALAEAGLHLESPGIEVVSVECSLEGGAAEAERILRGGGERPTAILAMADAVALGVYEACRSLGLSVPGELGVVGFDDIPEAARALPGLTTVRQPGMEKGAAAASLVVDLLAGKQVSHVMLPTSLVLRGSCAAPAPAPRD